MVRGLARLLGGHAGEVSHHAGVVRGLARLLRAHAGKARGQVGVVQALQRSLAAHADPVLTHATKLPDLMSRSAEMGSVLGGAC